MDLNWRFRTFGNLLSWGKYQHCHFSCWIWSFYKFLHHSTQLPVISLLLFWHCFILLQWNEFQLTPEGSKRKASLVSLGKPKCICRENTLRKKRNNVFIFLSSHKCCHKYNWGRRHCSWQTNFYQVQVSGKVYAFLSIYLFVSFHSTDQSNMGLSVLRQSTEEHRLWYRNPLETPAPSYLSERRVA